MPINKWKRFSSILNDLGCPFVPENEPNEDHVTSDLFSKPSPQREKLIRWCTTQVHTQSKEMKIYDCVHALGLCKTIEEAKNFAVGLLPKPEQECIWELLLKMLPKKESIQEETDFEAVMNKHFNNALFIDSVAERGCLQKQLDFPIEITPHGMERNKLTKGKGRVVEVPNIQVFHQLKEKASKEKSSLTGKLSSKSAGLISKNAEKNEDYDMTENTQNIDTALAELSTTSDSVVNKVPQFEVKFANELEHWLSGRGRCEVVSHPSIAATAQRMEKYEKYFASNVTITSSSHLVSSADITDNSGSNNTFLDIDTLSLT